MASVGLVTCMELPEPDPDEQLLVRTLRQADIDVELLAWDDPRADPRIYDLCVLRSCWNYHKRPENFLQWIDATDHCTQLVNSSQVVRWNLHKSYLQELEFAGIPVIPTVWFKRGDTVDLKATMLSQGWDDVVIKPTVSAGSYQTKRFQVSNVAAGQTFLETLSRERDTMVQRHMPSVEIPGERAMVWIDGKLSHAITKRPRLMGDDECVSGALPILQRDRQITDRILAHVNEDLLYARIDVVEDSNGGLLLSELELIEPSLYLLQSGAALRYFAGAIARRASLASNR